MVYKRNILFKLLLMRIAFILFLSLSVFLLFTPYSDYSVLTLIALVTVSCLSITNIEVYADYFEIRKYHVAGIIPAKQVITANTNFNIETILLESDLAINHDLIEEFTISPTSFADESYYKSFTINLIENGQIKKRIVEKLTNKEYELLFRFYYKNINP